MLCDEGMHDNFIQEYLGRVSFNPNHYNILPQSIQVYMGFCRREMRRKFILQEGKLNKPRSRQPRPIATALWRCPPCLPRLVVYLLVITPSKNIHRYFNPIENLIGICKSTSATMKEGPISDIFFLQTREHPSAECLNPSILH